MTLRLTEEETQALRETAAREGRSMQDVARSAVTGYVDRAARAQEVDAILNEELPRWGGLLMRLSKT